MRKPTRNPSSPGSGGGPAGGRGRQTAAGPHRVRRESLVQPAKQAEIVSTIRSALAHLIEVARVEKIPLGYLIESVVLVCLKHRDTFIRRRWLPNDDILRQIGLEVRDTARRRYRRDLAAGESPSPRACARQPGPAVAALLAPRLLEVSLGSPAVMTAAEGEQRRA